MTLSTQQIATYFHIDEGIVSFIPDLLADFDELGSSPETIVELLRTDDRSWEGAEMLDLGSGLGAASRAIARELRCRVTGVEALHAFVAEAERRAEVDGLARLCRFVCDDIRHFLTRDDRYDVALLLSVGDVLGAMDVTVGRVRNVVRQGGYMIIDDGYATESVADAPPGYEHLQTRDELLDHLTSHGDEIVREVRFSREEVRAQNRIYTERIAGRVRALSLEHPEHREAFERYLEREKKESAFLEDHVTCATWLLRRGRP